MKRVRRASGSEVDATLLAAMQRLWDAVWPPQERVSEDDPASDSRDRLVEPYEVLHFVAGENGRLVALCKSFGRTVREVETGRELQVLALAGVCSAPESRGSGLGRAVTLDAFGRLDEEPELFDVCLFQTGVPGFYEKLGARSVGNAFVNSKQSRQAGASPWWDDCVMVYPAAAKWLEGRVDLNGPGY